MLAGICDGQLCLPNSPQPMEDVNLSPILCLRRQEILFYFAYLGVSVDEMTGNRKTGKLECDTELVAF